MVSIENIFFCFCRAFAVYHVFQLRRAYERPHSLLRDDARAFEVYFIANEYNATHRAIRFKYRLKPKFHFLPTVYIGHVEDYNTTICIKDVPDQEPVVEILAGRVVEAYTE